MHRLRGCFQEAGTAGVHSAAAVRAKVWTGTPALHRLAKVRECCMPYWSKGPQLCSHAATIACGPEHPLHQKADKAASTSAHILPIHRLLVCHANQVKPYAQHFLTFKLASCVWAASCQGAMPKEYSEQAYPEAVPVIHKGQVAVAGQRCADKLLYNGGLSLRSLSGVAQQLFSGQQQVGVCKLCLRNRSLQCQ